MVKVVDNPQISVDTAPEQSLDALTLPSLEASEAAALAEDVIAKIDGGRVVQTNPDLIDATELRMDQSDIPFQGTYTLPDGQRVTLGQTRELNEVSNELIRDQDAQTTYILTHSENGVVAKIIPDRDANVLFDHLAYGEEEPYRGDDNELRPAGFIGGLTRGRAA